MRMAMCVELEGPLCDHYCLKKCNNVLLCIVCIVEVYMSHSTE